MNNREMRRLLRDAGFTPEPRARHEVWRHPSGVETMLHYGSHQSEHRRAATVRATIRRAARLASQAEAHG